MNNAVVFLICLLAVFIPTVLISRYIIPMLKSKKMGQKILDIGPRWHKSKEGTPTMGGLAFLLTVSVVGVVFSVMYAMSDGIGFSQVSGILFALALALTNGIIGIIDDLTKFKKSENVIIEIPSPRRFRSSFAERLCKSHGQRPWLFLL